MAWRSVDVDEQRIRFVVAASRCERSVSGLCVEFGISRSTGYLWLKRYGAGGVKAVVEQSRRPLSSPQRTAAAIEEQVVSLRRDRPDWGARKLAVLLERKGITLPAGTVHRILVRKGLIRVQDSHPAAPGRFQREEPNQLWQMDFKSPKGWDQPVGPLSVIDDHSRYALTLFQTGTTRGEAVREQLVQAFQDHGMPDAMLMDHGTPWWSATSAGGWTQFSVWLMKQGVQVYLSGIRHPQTQGKVERFHGSLEKARRLRGLPEPALRQNWLDDFRHDYNHVRPHQALGMSTPASCWKPSTKLYVPDPPPWTYPEHAEVHRLEKTGQLTLNGRRWQIAGALASERVRLIRIEQRILVFYRHTLVRELDLVSQGSTMVQPCDTKTNLQL